MTEPFYRRNIPFKFISLFLAVLLWFYVTNQDNPWQQRSFEIQPEVQGLASGQLLIEGPEPVKVVLRGAGNELARISPVAIKALLDLKDHTPGSAEIPVEVKFPNGFELVSVTPKQVTVITGVLTENQIPVSLEIKGEPAESYIVGEPVVSPSRIIIKGPQQVLESVANARVEIDSNGVAKNLTETIPVQLLKKDGGKLDDPRISIKPEVVEVFVPVFAKMEVKTVPIEVNVLDERPWVKNITCEPQTVRIAGSPELLSSIKTIFTIPLNLEEELTESILLERETGLLLPVGVHLVDQGSSKISVKIEIETG